MGRSADEQSSIGRFAEKRNGSYEDSKPVSASLHQ